MPEGLWIVVAIIVIVVVYTAVKIRRYLKLSERQWREVDKSKLKRWDDEDDDWPAR